MGFVFGPETYGGGGWAEKAKAFSSGSQLFLPDASPFHAEESPLRMFLHSANSY